MHSLGELLRRERLRQGLDIEQVASRTRISGRYIEAIENDDVDSLPGRFFYRSFVRQYASTLGLEESSLEDEMRQAMALEETPPVPVIAPAPLIEVPPIGAGSSDRGNRLPASLIVLVAVIIACAGLFALWQRARTPGTAAVAPPETVPAAAPSKPAEPEQASRTPEPQTAAPDAEPAKAAETVPAAAAPVAAPEQTPPAPAAAAPPPGPLGSGPLTVEVIANEPVWVSISTDGQNVVTRVLQPGDSRVVKGTGSIRILSGNAGGMTVRVNGQAVPDVGPRGQVRVVTVTPEGTDVSSPKRPEPAPAADTQQ